MPPAIGNVVCFVPADGWPDGRWFYAAVVTAVRDDGLLDLLVLDLDDRRWRETAVPFVAATNPSPGGARYCQWPALRGCQQLRADMT